MAVATIQGVPLLDESVQWELRAGVAPVVSEFLVSPDNARLLTDGSMRPVTLKIQSPGADGVEIRNLYVLEDRPGPNPKLKYIRVVDRRWYWDRILVRHSFNVRRNLGIRRVQAGFGTPEISPLLPNVTYAPWSLNGGAAWSAEGALKLVWETVQESEKLATGAAPTLVISSDIAALTGEAMPLEDVHLADNGSAAMARLLDFIPGARITVDADGTVRVYSAASGADRGILEQLGPEQDEGGHIEMITNDRIRPRRVRVFFEVEPELRFDYQEVEDAGSVAQDDEGLWADNVLAIPDYSFASGGTSLAQGTWISIGAYLADLASIPNFGKLTKTAIRRALVPFLDLWSGVRLASISDNTADWASRIGAIDQHFRRTYRINPRIHERVRGYRAYRCATIHPQTGGRAPATAYQDWAVVATQRFLSAAIGGGASSFAYAQNFVGYPAGGYRAAIGELSAAPVDVRILDNDQGIVGLDFRPNPTRTHEVFLPSTVENIPTGNLIGGLFAWNAVGVGRTVPALSATHRVAFIITASMGAPNSKRGLIYLDRGPKDIAPLLPGTLSGGLSDARGPVLEVLVRGGWETARVAWSDEYRSQILRALGLDSAESKGDMQSLVDAGLVVNMGSQTGLGTSAASLDAIANSIAASVYAEYADRPEGERVSPVSHKARVDGFIESVMHGVLPNGEASTRVTMGDRSAPVLDLMSMMPTSTRAIILRLQTSGKGAS